MINILLKELYKITIDSVKDSRESTKFIFDKSDDIIKWIVGFFATIIAFLISEIKMKNIESLKNSDLEYIILIYSFIIIILGLLFRMFSFLTQITQLKFFEISLWGNPKFRRTIFCVFW